MIKLYDTIIWSFPAAVILLMISYLIIRAILIPYEKNDKLWSKLEMIWIFVGFAGVISVVNVNRLSYFTSEAKFQKSKIEDYSNRVLTQVNLKSPCTENDQARISIIDSLDKKQITKLCNWKGQVSKELITFTSVKPISQVPKFIDEEIIVSRYYVDNLKKYINDYNYSISEVTALKKWKYLKDSFGFIFLILAFALRLVIARRNVMKQK